MSKIPQNLLVAVVFVVGISLFFVVQRPYSVCDAQKQTFMDAQKGKLFSYEVKGQKKSAQLGKLLESCKLGASPGACYELFSTLKSVVRDLGAAPTNCFADFSDLAPLQKALTETLELLAIFAWGQQPPGQGPDKYGWLEASDIHLFCNLKKFYLQIYGSESYESLIASTQKKFPGEAIAVVDGRCLNCENRKTATQVFSKEEIWVRSLYSVRCDQF
jgi:hypothetical protein